MAAYTFISSRDPVDGDRLVHQLATDLAKAGNEVALFLVENGALLARKGAAGDLLTTLTGAGVSVMADSFALRERGIGERVLASGVTVSELETIIDHMAAGRRVSWH